MRNAVPGDALRVATIHVQSWQSAYRGVMPDEFLDSILPKQRLERWKKWIGRETVGVLVFDTGELLTGFVSFRPEPINGRPSTVAEITALYVHPEHWRVGYGSELLRAALSGIEGGDYDKASLWVLEDNSSARRFYEAHGFSTDGIVKVDTELVGAPLRNLQYRMDLE